MNDVDEFMVLLLVTISLTTIKCSVAWRQIVAKSPFAKVALKLNILSGSFPLVENWRNVGSFSISERLTSGALLLRKGVAVLSHAFLRMGDTHFRRGVNVLSGTKFHLTVFFVFFGTPP